ncbi:hypothetical protein [Vibrio coralliilyticus]|uniref:hypothetical protein n=1 Tax=Vibrio coralliilyticus TaxID=190893 RepID=UPI0002F81D0A|nr:hypothetical protein [Vibrio coralliilyticus]
MELNELLKMKGEWVGTGKMSVGENVGEIQEYIKLEETDVEGCLSYIRKSRIDFPGRPMLHNELGYMQTSEMGLLLSRGSYEILEWNKSTQQYEQVASSPDSKEMIRKVTFPTDTKMIWDNSMQVDHRGHWVTHTAYTEFVSITKA